MNYCPVCKRSTCTTKTLVTRGNYVYLLTVVTCNSCTYKKVFERRFYDLPIIKEEEE